MAELNKNVRDTVFTQVFSQKRYQMELFNTFHPEETITEDDVKCINLTNHILRGMYNDLGLLVKNRLMVFVEAQTSWDEVLDLRLYFYLHDTIVEWMKEQGVTIHDVRRRDIPDAEFYVIYTGNHQFNKDNPFPDSFLGRDIHIITEAKDTSIVSQYIQFSYVVAKYVGREDMTNEEKAKAIIEECKEKNILAEFMEEHESEVYRSMISILDEEYIQRGRDNLARREGREEERERITALFTILLDEGKQELMAACIKDKDILEKTFKDYGL